MYALISSTNHNPFREINRQNSVSIANTTPQQINHAEKSIYQLTRSRNQRDYWLLVVVEERRTEKLPPLLENFLGERSVIRPRLVIKRRKHRFGIGGGRGRGSRRNRRERTAKGWPITAIERLEVRLS